MTRITRTNKRARGYENDNSLLSYEGSRTPWVCSPYSFPPPLSLSLSLFLYSDRVCPKFGVLCHHSLLFLFSPSFSSLASSSSSVNSFFFCCCFSYGHCICPKCWRSLSAATIINRSSFIGHRPDITGPVDWA